MDYIEHPIRFLSIQSDKLAAENVLKNLCFSINISSIGVYFIELATGDFARFCHQGNREILPSVIDSKILGEFSFRLREGIKVRDIGNGLKLIPITRALENNNYFSMYDENQYVIGWLAVYSEQNPKLTDSLVAHLLVLGEIVNRRFMESTLSVFSTPIDTRLHSDQFYAEILENVQIVFGAVSDLALRTFNEQDDLEVVGHKGFENEIGSPPKFSKFKLPPPFKTCIHEHRVVVDQDPKLWIEEYEVLKGRDYLTVIVAPMYVGREIIGTLSFATPFQYSLSKVERLSIEVLAHGFAVAISNFVNNKLVLESDELKDLYQAPLQLAELAQDLSHRIKKQSGTIEKQLDEVSKSTNAYVSEIEKDVVKINKIRNNSRSKYLDQLHSDVTESIADAKSQFVTFHSLIDSLNVSTHISKEQLSQVDIREAFLSTILTYEQSLKNVGFNLRSKSLLNGSETGIYFSATQSNISKKSPILITGYKVGLVSVFMNLVSNTIDAYALKSSQMKREIRLTYLDQESRGGFHVIEYRDKAGGLKIQALRDVQNISEDAADKSVIVSVLKKGITTKGSEGTGWGLSIVNRIICKLHKGSIDVKTNDIGTVFTLKISKIIS